MRAILHGCEPLRQFSILTPFFCRGIQFFLYSKVELRGEFTLVMTLVLVFVFTR